MVEQNKKVKNSLFSEEVFLILRELSSDSQLTQRELARRIGISLGKTNYLIRQLAQRGSVKIISPSRKNHKQNRISYRLTPQGVIERTKLIIYFLERKQLEYKRLREEWEGLIKKHLLKNK